VHDITDLSFVLLESLVNSVRDILLVNNDVHYADCEAFVNEPVVDYKLGRAQEISTNCRSILFCD